MKLIVGLGNPGPKYEDTRHNLGFMAINELCTRLDNTRLRETTNHSIFGSTFYGGERVVLAKPTTYMNNSGWAVDELLHRFDLGPESLLVIYDDMALPVGTIRIRPRGSAGGHNGMKSIIKAVGTQDFARLRMGIGSPDRAGVDHVLSRFGKSEWDDVDDSIHKAAEATFCYLEEGVEAAMQSFNRRLESEE